MKLGVAPGSYLFTRGLTKDGNVTPASLQLLDPPLRFYRESPRDFISWLIGRARHFRQTYGLDCIATLLERIDEPYVAKVRELLKSSGIRPSYLVLEPDFLSSGGRYFLAPPAAFKKSLSRVSKYLEAAKKLGTNIVGTGNPFGSIGRFSKNIPLEKQLQIYAENVAEIAEIASSFKLKVAIENNGDYRVSELVRVIERTKRDNIMLNFDTGNTMLVVEDPVEAARKAAPYTITTHLKDNFFQSVVWYGAKIFGVPVGQGHIDFEKILDILEKDSPDPKNLSLNVEVMAPEGDEDDLVEESLRYVSDHFSSYLR